MISLCNHDFQVSKYNAMSLDELVNNVYAAICLRILPINAGIHVLS